ncbi:hypothetical protein FB45DRAFT_901512, partial [Roridomyces roridus]
LERFVFESAADDCLADVPKLLQVARRVQEWLESRLYSLLKFDSSRRSTHNALNSVASKSPSFRAKVVSHVLLYSSTNSLPNTTLAGFLESCPGIKSLHIIGDNVGPHLLQPLAAMHQLTRLSIDIGELFGNNVNGDLTHPLFRSITHLEILDDTYFPEDDEDDLGPDWLTGPALGLLPALTHLALNSAPHPAVVHPILERFQESRLRVLLILFPPTQPLDVKRFSMRLRLQMRGWLLPQRRRTTPRTGKTECGGETTSLRVWRSLSIRSRGARLMRPSTCSQARFG